MTLEITTGMTGTASVKLTVAVGAIGEQESGQYQEQQDFSHAYRTHN
jgi:hypothetical protein